MNAHNEGGKRRRVQQRVRWVEENVRGLKMVLVILYKCAALVAQVLLITGRPISA